MFKRLLIFSLLFSTIGLADENCPLARLTLATGKTIAFPLFFPMHVLSDRMWAEFNADYGQPLPPFWKSLARRTLKDIPFFLLYAGSVTLNQLMDPTYYDEELEEDIQESREKHGEKIPEGLKIFVNVFDPNNAHYSFAKKEFELAKQKTKDLVYLEAESLTDAVAQVQKKAHELNEPVALLSLNGHGNPGSIEGSDEKSLVNGGFGYWAFRPRSKKHKFFHLDPNLFKKDAQIEFHACSVGQGETGRKALKAIGDTLLPKGGVIYAPTLPLTGGLISQEFRQVDSVRDGFYLVAPTFKLPYTLERHPDLDPNLSFGQRLNIREHSLVRIKIEASP